MCVLLLVMAVLAGMRVLNFAEAEAEAEAVAASSGRRRRGGSTRSTSARSFTPDYRQAIEMPASEFEST